MATYFKAPASYTGEDTVEIACHGGMLVTKLVLEAALRAGARYAEAGEFTRRALINGKLSLTGAEAISGLLEAESIDKIRLSNSRSRDLLQEKVEEIRNALTSLLSSIYARIDYPDEDLGDYTDAEALGELKRIKSLATLLSATYKTGKAVSEGIDTVICGKPNVGKSSIYNLLLGKDAAIVTSIEGTTRDVLSDKIPLGRVLLNLSDTAGIRKNTSDPIEEIGIDRSKKRIAESELILAVFDASRKLDSEDEALIEELNSADGVKIAILNKNDLPALIDKKKIKESFNEVIEISAEKEKTGAREEITAIIDRLFTDGNIRIGEAAIISSARQNAALMRAIDFIDAAIGAYELGFMQDLASSDVEKALGAIAELDGRAVSEEVVNDIFAKFCVGK
jgi:tRNA modification GTPase